MSIQTYHTHLTPEDVGDYIIMPGSPERVTAIAKFLEDTRDPIEHRGYRTVVGMLFGQKVTVISSLISCSNVDIVLHEIIEMSRDPKRLTAIRPGTCGSIAESVKIGHYCITTGAVRDDGIVEDYVPLGYPAVTDIKVTLALQQACQETGVTFHTGITHCKGAFNIENPKAKIPLRQEARRRFEMYRDANVLATSMEASAGCIIASINGFRFGEILQVVGDTMNDVPIAQMPSDEELAKIAVEAMIILILQDYPDSHKG